MIGARIVLLITFLVFSLLAKADQFSSTAFMFSGTCTGNDHVYEWRISGKPDGVWNLQSWLQFSVNVIGIELVKFSGNEHPVGPSVWWMIGSTFSSGDPIAFMSPNEDHVMRWFPAGREIYIPGTSDPDFSPKRYLDLHGACFGGGPVNFWVVLYWLRSTNTSSQ